MRLGFTIIFNGLHHLKHNNYAERLVDMLDYWAIVEGYANPNGTTRWCKDLSRSDWCKDGHSVDGTVDYLMDLDRRHDNVLLHDWNSVFFNADGVAGWISKDSMVKSAIGIFLNQPQHVFNECDLWQIDVDEQWTQEQMDMAEGLLNGTGAKTGMFLCDFYVGRNLIAKGDWGEGRLFPYRRLWKWNGELFKTHEPPMLEGGNGLEVLLPPRFKHYAYYFDQDVKFKEDYYRYAGLFERWKKIQDIELWTMPVSELIDDWWGRTDTIIERVVYD